METNIILQEKQIVSKIYRIREQRVMLDVDLAEIYGVPTRRVREQVKRNLDRFPADFMFELSRKELLNLSSYAVYDKNQCNMCLTTHFASSNDQDAEIQGNTILIPQNGESRLQISENHNNKSNWGGSVALPFAFSEHGILMLSNILNSPQAMKASIDIIRVFVKMRDFLLSNQEILTKISELGHKVGEHDQYIQTLYEYLKSFDEEQKRRIEWENRKPIGFVVRQE